MLICPLAGALPKSVGCVVMICCRVCFCCVCVCVLWCLCQIFMHVSTQHQTQSVLTSAHPIPSNACVKRLRGSSKIVRLEFVCFLTLLSVSFRVMCGVFFSSISASFYRFSAVFEAVILFITRRSIVFISSHTNVLWRCARLYATDAPWRCVRK